MQRASPYISLPERGLSDILKFYPKAFAFSYDTAHTKIVSKILLPLMHLRAANTQVPIKPSIYMQLPQESRFTAFS